MRWGAAVGLMVLAVGSASCGAPAKAPGVPVGSFQLSTTLRDRQCDFDEVPGTAFSFDATVSRVPGSTTASLRMRGTERSATLEGQRLTSEASARRVFTKCSHCNATVVETITLELYSVSQANAVGGVCPGDEGPAPEGPGSVPIVFGDFGSDARMGCGTLSNTLTLETSDGGVCDCQAEDGGQSGCRLTFGLTGVRQ